MSGLHLRVGDQPDVLVAALAADLAAPRDDPFEPDLVAVPTQGQGRWLLQRLGTVLGVTPGRTDGVAARIELPTPTRLLRDLEHEAVSYTHLTLPTNREV